MNNGLIRNSKFYTENKMEINIGNTFNHTKINNSNQIDRSGIVYKGVPSAHVPVPHSDKLPVPIHPSQLNSENSSFDAKPQTISTSSQPSDSDFIPPVAHPLPSLISQDHLNRIVRKLNLSHKNAMALASELKGAHILAPGVEIKHD